MTDKTYIVQFAPPQLGTQHMTAASADVYGDRLVLLNSNEEAVAIFLLDTVESWTVTNTSVFVPEGFCEALEWGGDRISKERYFDLSPRNQLLHGWEEKSRKPRMTASALRMTASGASTHVASDSFRSSSRTINVEMGEFVLERGRSRQAVPHPLSHVTVAKWL